MRANSGLLSLKICDWFPPWLASIMVTVAQCDQQTISSWILHACRKRPSVLYLKIPNRSCILTPKAPCLCKVLGRPFVFICPFTAFKSHKLKNWTTGTQDTFSKRNIHKIVFIVDNKHIIVPSFSNEVKQFGCVCICSSLIRHLFFFLPTTGILMGGAFSFLIETISLSTWFASEHPYLTIII